MNKTLLAVLPWFMVPAAAFSQNLQSKMVKHDVSIVSIRILDETTKSILELPGKIGYGAALTPWVTVRNLGTFTETFSVTFTIGTTYWTAYTQTRNKTLEPNAVDSVTFPTWTAYQRGTHTVRCSVALPGDENPSNNVLSNSVACPIPGSSTSQSEIGIKIEQIVNLFLAFGGESSDFTALTTPGDYFVVSHHVATPSGLARCVFGGIEITPKKAGSGIRVTLAMSSQSYNAQYTGPDGAWDVEEQSSSKAKGYELSVSATLRESRFCGIFGVTLLPNESIEYSGYRFAKYARWSGRRGWTTDNIEEWTEYHSSISGVGLSFGGEFRLIPHLSLGFDIRVVFASEQGTGSFRTKIDHDLDAFDSDTRDRVNIDESLTLSFCRAYISFNLRR